MTNALVDYSPPMTTPDPASESRQWLTRSETADLLGFSTQTLDRYARDGRLTRYRRGGRATRYRVEDVESLRAELTAIEVDKR